MKRICIGLLAALTWMGSYAQNLSSNDGPLAIARQGSFAVGGTVIRHPGTYDNRQFVGFGTPVEQGQSYHGDHAAVDYQIPVGTRRLHIR